MKFFMVYSRLINFQQVKSFILNNGSHVKWLSNVSLLIAITVDTSEMRFLEEKKSICIRLYENRGLLSVCLPVCLSVLLMNKTSTNSLIFYFDKAKQKNVCLDYMKNIVPKYFVLFF